MNNIPKIVSDSGGDVKREMLACAVDVSDGTGEPEYLVIGYKIDSSALEYEMDVENGVDIRGQAYGSVNKMTLSQTFEPHRMSAGDNGKLAAKLAHYARFGELAKFSQFKCIVIHGYLESTGKGFVSDMYDACTIVQQSIGGETWLEMPFTITFGGAITRGMTDARIGIVEFTPDTVEEGTSVKTIKSGVDTNVKK